MQRRYPTIGSKAAQAALTDAQAGQRLKPVENRV
jgi:hypothetical protein